MEYVKRIIRKYPRSAIVLFGSRAKGEETPYSDYDLTVILEDIDDKLKIIMDLRRLKPHGLDLDLIVLDKNDLDDPLIKAMLRTRKILYNGLNLDL